MVGESANLVGIDPAVRPLSVLGPQVGVPKALAEVGEDVVDAQSHHWHHDLQHTHSAPKTFLVDGCRSESPTQLCTASTKFVDIASPLRCLPRSGATSRFYIAWFLRPRRPLLSSERRWQIGPTVGKDSCHVWV